MTIAGIHRERWDTFLTPGNVGRILGSYVALASTSKAEIRMERTAEVKKLTLTLEQNLRESQKHIMPKSFPNLDDIESIKRIVMKGLLRRNVEVVSTIITDPERKTTTYELNITEIRWKM